LPENTASFTLHTVWELITVAMSNSKKGSVNTLQCSSSFLLAENYGSVDFKGL